MIWKNYYALEITRSSILPSRRYLVQIQICYLNTCYLPDVSTPPHWGFRLFQKRIRWPLYHLIPNMYLERLHNIQKMYCI